MRAAAAAVGERAVAVRAVAVLALERGAKRGVVRDVRGFALEKATQELLIVAAERSAQAAVSRRFLRRFVLGCGGRYDEQPSVRVWRLSDRMASCTWRARARRDRAARAVMLSTWTPVDAGARRVRTVPGWEAVERRVRTALRGMCALAGARPSCEGGVRLRLPLSDVSGSSTRSSPTVYRAMSVATA